LLQRFANAGKQFSTCFLQSFAELVLFIFVFDKSKSCRSMVLICTVFLYGKWIMTISRHYFLLAAVLVGLLAGAMPLV
jgi:hypothetical protein